MTQPVEPRYHNGFSRSTAAIGEGASTGFRGGLLGGLLGFTAAVVGGAALFALGGAAIGALGAFAVASVSESLAIGASILATLPFAAGIGAAIGGVGGAIVSGIPTMIGAIGGGLLGFGNGASRASVRTGQEMEAARFQQAYAQTRAQLQQAQLMEALQPRQPQPAMPVMPMAAANDNPYIEASPQVDAATVAHQDMVAERTPEQAKG